MFIHIRQRKKHSHGIDIFRCAPRSEASREPVLDDSEVGGVVGERVVLPDAVEADAVGPFPVVPAFGVDYAAVGEGEEEGAGVVADGDEGGDEVVDGGVDCGGG